MMYDLIPPDGMIARAEQAAEGSPCAKSKRGAVVYASIPEEDGRVTRIIMNAGHNGPPSPFSCLNNAVCKADCNKRCVHAEGRALRGAMASLNAAWSRVRDPKELSMLHVKIGADNKVVAGGGPSCWQCSREILDAGIHGIWLFQDIESTLPAGHGSKWIYYTAKDFHELTLDNCGIEY